MRKTKIKTVKIIHLHRQRSLKGRYGGKREFDKRNVNEVNFVFIEKLWS